MIPAHPSSHLSLPFFVHPFSPFLVFPFLFHSAFLTHFLALVSSITVVEVDLHIYMVHSSHLLKVTVHTGVSVQRRDRCTGMQ